MTEEGNRIASISVTWVLLNNIQNKCGASDKKQSSLVNWSANHTTILAIF